MKPGDPIGWRSYTGRWREGIVESVTADGKILNVLSEGKRGQVVASAAMVLPVRKGGGA